MTQVEKNRFKNFVYKNGVWKKESPCAFFIGSMAGGMISGLSFAMNGFGVLNLFMCIAVCSYLNQNGYEATGCLNANEAYDAMYGGNLYDLIVSDIMMPEIDEFKFAQTVREQNQEIPILFMSARKSRLRCASSI